MNFILASKSKRRAEILKSCGVRHKVFITNAREVKGNVGAYCPLAGAGNTPLLVVENAKRKAIVAAGYFKKSIVLGVDTVVLFKGKNIGKPRDKSHARAMLKAFSGQRIIVYSGLYLVDTESGRKSYGFDKTFLRVKPISDKEIDRFFLKLGPYDRTPLRGQAGGFSIEGAGSIIFDNINGSYFNVLGLPMGKLAELFKKIGLDILDFMR